MNQQPFQNIASSQWSSGLVDYAQQNEMRSGDSMRDLYYQSPYLKRFSANRLTPFSNEKESANKENISPLSGSNLWITSNPLLRSGGGAGSTIASSTNTIQSTPIQNQVERQTYLFNSQRQQESPNFAIFQMDSASSSHQEEQLTIQQSDRSTSSFHAPRRRSSQFTPQQYLEKESHSHLPSFLRNQHFPQVEEALYEDVINENEEMKAEVTHQNYYNHYQHISNPFGQQDSRANHYPGHNHQAVFGFDVQFQTIEEVQSDIGEIDSNSDTTHSQRTSNASLSQQENYNQAVQTATIQQSALRLRSRPALQERSDLEQTPNSRSSIIKKINFSHSKGGTQKKSKAKAKALSKAVLQQLR